MRISKNKFVSVVYDLNVGEEEHERELMERATKERPLQFIYGVGGMLPAFEENIRELEPGATFRFSLAPKDAYGEYLEDHVIELPKSVFEVNGKFDDDSIREGVTLPMINSEGERMNGSVYEVKEKVVVMDFNHPLAGETLHFSGEVLDVHEPTAEDIAAMNSAMNCGCGCGCGGCEGGDAESCGCGCGDDYEKNGCGCGCGG
jgi:FKBP-type peptidyl-prolyl cis-trans isomerase SlyD